jgi:hypothetical protein
MAFRGGPQKEQIPEREAEAPKVLEFRADTDDLKGSIFDTPWEYERNLRPTFEDTSLDPDPYLIIAHDLLLDSVSLMIKFVSRGEMARVGEYAIANMPINDIIGIWSKSGARYHDGYKEISEMIMKQPKKYFHEGNWNQTSPVLGEGPGVFSSVQVSFADEDKIGGRIGIRWHPERGEKDAGWKRDAVGKAWWGEIKLTMDYDFKTKEFEWDSHVRCEWDRADDWETSQSRIDKHLKQLVAEYPHEFSPNKYASATDCARALKNVDSFLKKIHKERKSKQVAEKEVREEHLRK